MQITIDRNGEWLGPFTVDEVNSKLADGTLSPTDKGCQSGVADWVPLSQIPGVRHLETSPAKPLEGTQITVSTDGVNISPLSIEQVNQMAGGGTFFPSDPAWHEGLSGWVRLDQIQGFSPEEPTEMPEPEIKHSRRKRKVKSVSHTHKKKELIKSAIKIASLIIFLMIAFMYHQPAINFVGSYFTQTGAKEALEQIVAANAEAQFTFVITTPDSLKYRPHYSKQLEELITRKEKVLAWDVHIKGIKDRIISKPHTLDGFEPEQAIKVFQDMAEIDLLRLARHKDNTEYHNFLALLIGSYPEMSDTFASEIRKRTCTDYENLRIDGDGKLVIEWGENTNASKKQKSYEALDKFIEEQKDPSDRHEELFNLAKRGLMQKDRVQAAKIYVGILRKPKDQNEDGMMALKTEEDLLKSIVGENEKAFEMIEAMHSCQDEELQSVRPVDWPEKPLEDVHLLGMPEHNEDSRWKVFWVLSLIREYKNDFSKNLKLSQIVSLRQILREDIYYPLINKTGRILNGLNTGRERVDRYSGKRIPLANSLFKEYRSSQEIMNGAPIKWGTYIGNEKVWAVTKNEYILRLIGSKQILVSRSPRNEIAMISEHGDIIAMVDLSEL